MLMVRFIVFFSGLTVFFQNIRLPGINFTIHDLSIVLIAIAAVLFKGDGVKPPFWYWLSSFSLVITAGLAVVFSVYIYAAVQHYLQLIFIFFVYIPVLSLCLYKESWSFSFFKGLLCGGVVTVIVALVSYLSGADEYIGGRYVGHLGDPQSMAFIVALTFSFFVYMASDFDIKGKGRPIIWIAAVFVMLGFLWIIIRTASKSGMGALLFSVFIYLFFLFFSKKMRVAVGLRFLSVGFFAVFITFFSGVDFSEFYLRFSERVDTLQSQDSILGGRAMLIEEGMSLMDWEHLLFGYGFENVQHFSSAAKKPHNIFVLYFLEGGAVFLFCYVALLFFMLFICFRKFLSIRGFLGCPQHFYYYFLGASLLAGYLMISFFNTVSLFRPCWIGVALILAGEMRQQENEAELK